MALNLMLNLVNFQGLALYVCFPFQNVVDDTEDG